VGKGGSSAPEAAKSPVTGKRDASAPEAARSPVTGKRDASAPEAARSYPVPGRRSSTGRSASVDLSHEAADLADEQSPAAGASASSPGLRRQATAAGLGPDRPAPREKPPSLAGASASATERTWPGLGNAHRRPTVGREALTGEEEELVEYQVDQPSDPFGDLPAARCDDVAETDPVTGRVSRRGRARRSKRREERWDDTSSVRQLYREAVDEIAGDQLKDKRGRKKSWFR
jgi:hypothetical protein